MVKNVKKTEENQKSGLKNRGKKRLKIEPKTPKTALGLVMMAAGVRLALKSEREGCHCALVAEEERPAGIFPAAADSGWCPFCAIEAEQVAQGEPAALYGEALRNLAFEINGEAYDEYDGEVHAVVIDWFEENSDEIVIETFEGVVDRLEGW